MYAPVCTRFVTYGVELDERCCDYVEAILDLEPMDEWVREAQLEPDEVRELEMEF